MKQPVPTLPATIRVAEPVTKRLANGARIYLLPSADYEVLRLSFVFHAGSVVQHVPFSASATANLLAEGSETLTAQQIAERLDFYGSWYDVSIDRDYAYISFAMLRKFFDRTLAVAEEILLRPAFPEEEVRTYCAKRRQRLAIDRTKVDVQSAEAFAAALYGPQHPYGVTTPEAAYDRLERGHIASFFRSRYTAANCFVVCSGRIDDAVAAGVEALASRLPEGGDSAAVALPEPATRHEAWVDHPGAVQTSLRIGRLLFPRNHPDFVGMQVVAAALGGYFGSRLMRNLRERNGYTYGVGAALVNFEQSGYLAIATQVGTDAAHAALAEIYAEIERLREEPMSAEELDLVKRIMAGEMMRILDGPFGIADVTIENVLCGEDNGFVARNLRAIEAMTPRDVQELAQRYLARESLVTAGAGAVKW